MHPPLVPLTLVSALRGVAVGCHHELAQKTAKSSSETEPPKRAKFSRNRPKLTQKFLRGAPPRTPLGLRPRPRWGSAPDPIGERAAPKILKSSKNEDEDQKIMNILVNNHHHVWYEFHID